MSQNDGNGGFLPVHHLEMSGKALKQQVVPDFSILGVSAKEKLALSKHRWETKRITD